MGLSPVLLIGPFVAAVGLVAVMFVMRHRSVQTKSMYSARRSQIERKVRAARQRTLAPTGRHAEKEAEAEVAQDFAAPGMAGKSAVPTATWGPPPTVGPEPAPPPAAQPAWDLGPTAPPASPPPYAPPPEPAYAPPPEVWTPAPAPVAKPVPVEPPAPAFEPMPAPAEPAVSRPSGGGAAWEIVGSESSATEVDAAGRKKGKKEASSLTGAWQLASGDAPGEDAGDEIKRPSAAMAIAQYAVLVVGLVMVLIGVIVMVANQQAG